MRFTIKLNHKLSPVFRILAFIKLNQTQQFVAAQILYQLVYIKEKEDRKKWYKTNFLIIKLLYTGILDSILEKVKT